MKKIYILAVALVAFAFTGTSQIIEDDFEFYTLGEMGTQNPFIWTSWTNDGGATGSEGLMVTDAFGNPGASGAVLNAGQDPMLLLENQTSGDYTIKWDMYIPAGQTGYFNIQGEVPPQGTVMTGVWNSGNIYFNEDGTTPGEGADVAGGAFVYPEDTWFTVSIYIDLDAGTPAYTMSVDGIASAPVDFQTDSTLGGINFYRATGSTEYYLDNVLFVDGVLGTESFDTKGFVTSMRNSQLALSANEVIDTVAIYNMLGQEVYNSKLGATSAIIDMSSFANGTYIVRASINGTVGSIKVIK